MTVYVICMYNIHTMYIHNQTCTCDCCIEFILVQTMYIPCTDMASTISRFYEHVYREIKKRQGVGLELMTLCMPASCHNHYSTSVNTNAAQLRV